MKVTDRLFDFTRLYRYTVYLLWDYLRLTSQIHEALSPSLSYAWRTSKIGMYIAVSAQTFGTVK